MSNFQTFVRMGARCASRQLNLAKLANVPAKGSFALVKNAHFQPAAVAHQFSRGMATKCKFQFTMWILDLTL